MKNNFVVGLAVGAMAVAAVCQMDNDMDRLWRKSRKFLKHKIMNIL